MPRRTPNISDPDFKYLVQLRKVSEKMHAQWAAIGRETVEYREHRRFTRHVYREFENKSAQTSSILQEVPINLYATFHDAIRPALSLGRWRANAHPAKSRYADATQRFEDNVNWAMDVTGWDRETELCDINFLDYGRAVIKTGIGTHRTTRELARGTQPIYDPIMGGQSEYHRDITGRNGRNGGEPEDHVEYGGRRYPRGVVWQRSVNPEDVVLDYRSGQPDDCGVIWQKHYLDERKAEALLKELGSHVSLSALQKHMMRSDIEHLETERDKRYGPMWAQLESLPQAPQYLFYETWWREEDKWVWECPGYNKGPIHVDDWPGPDGIFPYTFFDDARRQDRLYPLGKFAGLSTEQDQINVINSMVIAAVRQMKTLIFFLKGLVDGKERLNIEKAGPLTTIVVKHNPKESIFIHQIQQDIRQWVETISRLEAEARRRFGLALEQLGAPSDVDSATQSMFLNQTSQLLSTDRTSRKNNFLRECVTQRQRWMAVGHPLWPEHPNGGRMYEGAMGIASDDSYYEMEVGFTREEIQHPVRWKIDVVSMNPIDAQNQFERFKEWAKFSIPFGATDPWGADEYVKDLLEIRRPGLSRPRPEIPDAHEEHALILKGVPVAMTEHEDHNRHYGRHMQLVGIVHGILQGGDPQGADPIHLGYVEDTRLGEESPHGAKGRALEMVLEHIEQYKKAGVAGAQGQKLQSLAKANASPSASQEGKRAAGARQQRASGAVPFGAENKGPGRSIMQGP